VEILADEKNKYVLYEYLLYFWHKKWFFLIVPAITTVLVIAGIYVLKSDEPYTGESLVYTGGVDSGELVHPKNVFALFDDEAKRNLDVFVSEKGHVKFTVKGDSQAEVEKQLTEVVSLYEAELLENYQLRLDASKVYLEKLETSVETLTVSVENYKEKLNEDLTPVEMEEITDLIIETEDDLAENEKIAHRMRSDLVFFEEPKLLSESVAKSNSYLKESIAIGIVLGLVLTVLLLMLLKYLGVARRYYRHD
jgi:uncharacterized protein (UPF0333 family)